MKVSFQSKGGFDNVLKWLGRSSKIDPALIREIADYGDTQLASQTPQDTGETAQGWKHDVVVNRDSVEVSWKNTAHPESEVNVATLIELGHGTGTGGYVPPRPYIKQSMKPVWRKLDNDVKGLMK